jgi:hypothetical protein
MASCCYVVTAFPEAAPGLRTPALGYSPQFKEQSHIVRGVAPDPGLRPSGGVNVTCPVGSVAQNLGGQGNETVSVAITPPPCPRCGERRVDEYTHYGCPESSGEPHRHWLCAECDMEFVTPSSDVPSEPPQATTGGKQRGSAAMLSR